MITRLQERVLYKQFSKFKKFIKEKHKNNVYPIRTKCKDLCMEYKRCWFDDGDIYLVQDVVEMNDSFAVIIHRLRIS